MNSNDISAVVADLTAMLNGEEGLQWYQESKKFLQRRNTWDGIIDLMTIKIGTSSDVKKLIKALNAAGEVIKRQEKDPQVKALSKIILADKAQLLDLVAITPSSLGVCDFLGSATMEEICKAAVARGLIICPEEAALQLMVAHVDQPAGGSLDMITRATLNVEEKQNFSGLKLYGICNNGTRRHFDPLGTCVGISGYAKCVFIRAVREP